MHNRLISSMLSFDKPTWHEARFSISLYDRAATDRVLSHDVGNYRYDVLRIEKVGREDSTVTDRF